MIAMVSRKVGYLTELGWAKLRPFYAVNDVSRFGSVTMW